MTSREDVGFIISEGVMALAFAAFWLWIPGLLMAAAALLAFWTLGRKRRARDGAA